MENQALNPQQMEATDHKNGPLLISAGAGSGKTRTLTQRLIKLIEGGVRPEKIVAITFTNKAADEIKSRIMSQIKVATVSGLPFLGTFHSFGARILRDEVEFLGRTKNFVIFDNDDSLKLIKKVLKALDMSSEKFPPAKIQKRISKMKDELSDPEGAEELFQIIFKEYEKGLKSQNAFDFDDLIEKVVRVLEAKEDVLDKYQKLFEYVLVDEFQDINTSQYMMVKLLSGKHRNLNVVGDDNQSIYGFRGADFRNFLNFERDWPEAKIINLGENYRSSQNIVRAASEVIKHNQLQRPKELWTNNPEGSPIKVIASVNAEEEAERITSELLSDEGSVSRAIIYRTNAQSRAIEQSLNFNSIPYEVFGGLKFYERKEIKDIIAGVRYGFNPKDITSLERLAKTFRKAETEELREQLPNLAMQLNPVELIGFFLKTAGYPEYLENKFDNSEERMENIKELINFASTFNSIADFIQRVSLLQATDKIGTSGAKPEVRLTTIHLAKGLEFESVYMAGVNDGLLPHERSLMSASDIEEERRLMYVAMTRARRNLILSFYGFASRFLYEIPPELIEFSGPGSLKDEDEIYLI